MKKIILITSMIIFAVIMLVLCNLEFTDISVYSVPVTDDYHYIYVAINQGVYGSMMGNYSYGFLNNYGLQSRYVQVLENGVGADKGFSEEDKYYQMEQYLLGIYMGENAKEIVYKSKVNLGGIVYSLLDMVIDKIVLISQRTKMHLFHTLSSLSVIALFLFIGYWCYKEFGLLSSLFVWTSLIGGIFLAPFGSGLSNSAFAYFFAFTISLIILSYEDRKGRKVKGIVEFLLILIAVAVKAMVGYELIPTVMVSCTVMYFYYAIARKWDIKYFIKRFVRVSLGAISGLVLTLTIHFTQLSLYSKSTKIGFGYLMESFGKRAWGNAENYEKNYSGSLKASFGDVVKGYFEYTKPRGLVFGLSLMDIIIIALILILITVGTYIFIKKKDRMNEMLQQFYRRAFALSLSVTVGALGAYSTLFVLKAHSYIHRAFTSIAFYIPFTMMVFAMAGYLFETMLRKRDALEVEE